MSALSGNPSIFAGTFIPLAILGASLAGSLHCVGMCGGLVTAVAQTRGAVARYHLGRLLGYVTLGGIAGYLGEKLFRETVSGGWLPWAAAVALGLSLVFLGVRVWREKPLHLALPSFLKGPYFSLFRHMSSTAFSAGLFSVFLPCGWLHSFVLGAVATRNPVTGAAFLGLFWLGSVPALVATPLLVKRILQPIAIRAPKLSGSLLVVAGIFALSYKVMPLTHLKPAQGGEGAPAQGVQCPHHPGMILPAAPPQGG